MDFISPCACECGCTDWAMNGLTVCSDCVCGLHNLSSAAEPALSDKLGAMFKKRNTDTAMTQLEQMVQQRYMQLNAAPWIPGTRIHATYIPEDEGTLITITIPGRGAGHRTVFADNVSDLVDKVARACHAVMKRAHYHDQLREITRENPDA